MARFGQHTRIRARPGKREELLAKFVEAVEMQHDNPACELTQRARQSPEVQAWAEDMPSLVDGPPEITGLDPVAIR